MADHARVSRVVAEVVGKLSDVGVSRIDAEVAGRVQASGEKAKVSRVVAEAVGGSPQIVGLSRVDAEVAGRVQASGEKAKVSRVVAEVVGRFATPAAVSRIDAEVAGKVQATAERLRVSSVSGEVVSRAGAAGPVVPLALNPISDVFLHNWLSKVDMRSTFLTSITSSPTGAEGRAGLRLKPNRKIKLRWENESQARLEDMYLRMVDMTNARFQVPLYQDQAIPTTAITSADTTVVFDTTKGRWFPGARVVLVTIDASHQFVSSAYLTIASKTDTVLTLTGATGVTIAAGQALILPVMDCEITLKPFLRLRTARRSTLILTVQEVPGASALPPLASDIPAGFPEFEERPIWNIEPDWSTQVRYGRDRQGKVFKQGRASAVDVEADRSRATHRFRTTSDRAEAFQIIKHFESRRGRLRSFWHIDQSQNWSVVDVDASGNFVSINPTGDLASVSAELVNEWVGIVMADGTCYVREVVTLQDIIGVYRMTLVTPLPTGLLVGDVVRVARARKTRYAKDELREKWTHTGLCVMTHKFIEVLKEVVTTTS